MATIRRPTFVLVHGAWHGAWCWDHVSPLLSAAGFEVVCLDLPGRGQNTEPLADLHGDADAVTSVLDAVAGPVVLVGHSYGGAVITEAGDHDKVVGLVTTLDLLRWLAQTDGFVLPGHARQQDERRGD